MYASVRVTFLEALVYLKASRSSTGYLTRQEIDKESYQVDQNTVWMDEEGKSQCSPLRAHSRYLLLLAEHLVLEGNKRAAETNYIAAITFAEIGGFLHDKALTHDLALARHTTMHKEMNIWPTFTMNTRNESTWSGVPLKK